MRRFFISTADIAQDQATLRGSEFHHLCHVLRLGVGAPVALTDDLGREHRGVITELSPSEATIALATTREATDAGVSLTLAQGILKGAKMDLVIEKATELGVNCILPFHSTFTVATVPADRQAERIARWERIAQSAAKQSGNPAPRIDPPQSFTALLETFSPERTAILCYEKERILSLKRFAQEHPQFESLCLIIGPEGGFSPEEIARARTARAHVVGLGTKILRAETAAIVASAFCQLLWNNQDSGRSDR
ncbi:MAG: 16S rRNA (uracil(1498)-N(3))-methyltransferase [Candidatus Binatia bacterium]